MTPKLIRTLSILLFLAVLTAAVSMNFRPEMITLGDSITQGTFNQGPTSLGYRRYLQDELGIWTYNLKGQFRNLGVSLHQRRHSGVGGETISKISERLPENLALLSHPGLNGRSVILIHAGTNDLRITPKTDEEMAYSLKAYDEMLTAIHAFNPAITIYAALLIPSTGEPCNSNVTRFNAKLTELVKAKGWPNLHYVDMNAAFKKDTFGLCRNDWGKYCMTDKLHPNQNGYRVMGKQWAACIKDPRATNCNGY